MTAEFSVAFRLMNLRTEPATAIAETRDPGRVCSYLDFTNPADPKLEFFHAQMTNGVIYALYPQLTGEISSSAVRQFGLKECRDGTMLIAVTENICSVSEEAVR